MPSSPTFKDEFFNTTLYLPGKTFLLGEYGALLGEAVLLCATAPQFLVRTLREPRLIGIHPQSPAGVLWERSDRSFGVEFVDPYDGAGGFGASGAQFLSVFALLEFHKSGQRAGPANWASLLQSYQDIVRTNDGKFSPSGADLIGQLTGQLCYFHRQNSEVQVLSWPFEDLDFVFFKTMGKVATHDHVQNLAAAQVQGLGQIAEQGFKSASEGSSEGFVQSVRNMYAALEGRGLILESTIELLTKLNSTGLVLAGKGCGALGADVLAVFCKPEHRQDLIGRGESLGLKFIASSGDVSPGLQWEWR